MYRFNWDSPGLKVLFCHSGQSTKVSVRHSDKCWTLFCLLVKCIISVFHGAITIGIQNCYKIQINCLVRFFSAVTSAFQLFTCKLCLQFSGLRMCNFTWNRFPIKNLLIDSLLIPIVESTYLKIQIKNAAETDHSQKIFPETGFRVYPPCLKEF